MNFQLTSHQGQMIPIQIRHSGRSRQLRLSFDPKEMSLELTLPPLVSSRMAEEFLKEKERWIQKQWERAQKIRRQFPPHAYRSGERFFYLGEAVALEVKASPRALNSRFIKRACRVVGDFLEVTIPPNLSASDRAERVGQAIEHFYKRKAAEVIHDRLEHLNGHYGFKYGRVTFRNQKTRWGSCSAKGNLNFNWRLVMAPIEVIDYVIAHELCHLRQMNHSQSFWSLVAKTIPEHKKWRKWLREKGEGLTF